jgi:hypothetical protein
MVHLRGARDWFKETLAASGFFWMPRSHEQGGLGAIFYLQFIEDVVQVLLDSLWTNEELLGDLCVGQALRYQSKDLQFSFGEHFDDVAF